MIKMVSRLTWALAILIGLSASSKAEDGRQDIVVKDRSQGCYHSEDGSHRFVCRDGDYAWRNQTVSRSDLDRIRQAILDASREPEGLLNALGITPEKVAAERDKILAASLPEHWQNKDGGLPPLAPEEEEILTYERLVPYLMDKLTSEGVWSTTSVIFRVRLPGSPRLEVASTWDRFCMLPFTVKCGEQTWKIYDPNIPRMLQMLADPLGPNYRRLDGFTYWSEEVWNDAMFWRFGPGEELDDAFSTRAYKAMNGYAAAAEVFRVKEVLSGCINLQDLSIHLDLEVVEPKLINGIWWWVPLRDGKTEHDWLGLIELLEQAERRVSQNEWVRRWRTGADDHKLELHAVGYRGYAEKDIDQWVRPPWQDAGLRGVPKYEFCLRDEGNRGRVSSLGTEMNPTRLLGKCYLGDEDDRILVTHLFVDGAPWPGIGRFCFHPKAPDYAIVNADGSVEMKRIIRQDQAN